MSTRKARLALAVIIGFSVANALADVPRETLERLAAIKVEIAKTDHLGDIGKLDQQEYRQRLNALNAEARQLWNPYRKLRGAELAAANATVDGIVNTNLSLLRPGWKEELAQYRAAGEAAQQKLASDLEADTHSAADLQRQRLLLRQQLDEGTINSETFAQKDREALNAITSLREKYQAIGGNWPKYFDQRLKQFTKAVADNPARPLPQSQVTAGSNAAPDFNRDVTLAASITAKKRENQSLYEQKKISPDSYREVDVIYSRDLNALRARYYAISPQQGKLFQSAIATSGNVQPITEEMLSKMQHTEPNKFTRWLPLLKDIGMGILSLAFFSTIAWFAYLFFKHATRPTKATGSISKNYGSARWAGVQPAPLSDAATRRGVMFGKSSHPDVPPDHPGSPILSTPESHVLIVARTRTGKGTRVIVPTLLRYAGSMLVIDPKGENAAVTARTRRDQLGQSVHIVNPWQEMADVYDKLGFKTATFNPLDAIERNDPNAVAVAQALATIICPKREGKDSYWQGSAANVLAGVFLWLADEPGETKTLARARELVTMSRAEFLKILVRMAASTAYHGAVKEMVSQYIDLAPETYSGIMSNLSENTKFLSDPRVKESTATSSFSVRRLLEEQVTIYLVIPHERIETHATWLRLIISAAMQGIKSRDKRVKPHHRCLFMIDEFGSIGHIADIPRDIALMSGYGLDFALIVQGLDQLKDHYGEAKDTILSNCGYKWFCYINDLSTARYISDSLGNATVQTVSKSQTSGHNPGGASSGSSTNYGEMGRPLLTPDEILNLGREAAILLSPVSYPRYLRPIDYWQLPDIFAHLKAEYPRLYWEPPFQYDPNPYAPGAQSEQKKKSAGSDERRPPPQAGMTEEQAREILGVSATATREEIVEAYKRLMGKVHPDKGGSNYFAKQLNEARSLLIGSSNGK